MTGEAAANDFESLRRWQYGNFCAKIPGVHRHGSEISDIFQNPATGTVKGILDGAVIAEIQLGAGDVYDIHVAIDTANPLKTSGGPVYKVVQINRS